MHSSFPHAPTTHTLSFPWAMALGVTHRGEEAHIAPGVLKLGKGTEVTTCFSDMSTAVNRAEGDFLDLEGGLGPSLVGGACTQSLYKPKNRGSGKLGSR